MSGRGLEQHAFPQAPVAQGVAVESEGLGESREHEGAGREQVGPRRPAIDDAPLLDVLDAGDGQHASGAARYIPLAGG